MTNHTGVSVHDVLRAANKIAGVDLREPCTKRSIAHMRFAAFAAAREIVGASYPRIGQVFGKDHTTVIWGVKRANRQAVERIAEAVRA